MEKEEARFNEYEELESKEYISQGDVIEWVGEDSIRPWKRFGVVVTADCDLFWQKGGSIVSYVPAFITEDFIWAQWRIERVCSKIEALLTKAAKRIAGWRGKNGASDNPPSAEAMRQWLERAGPDGLLDEIGVTNGGERNDLLNVLRPAIAVINVTNRIDPDLALLSKAYFAVNSKPDGDIQPMIADIQKSWSNLPGDVFHLLSMPTSEYKEKQEGLFLHLRHIRQVNSSDLTARPDEIRSGKAKAKRIARVSAPYRYAITQSLGRVFSDIGLPDEHDQLRKQAANLFFESRKSV